MNIVKASALAGLLLFATAAQAADNREVVDNTTGNIAVNTYGNCVRTKWADSNDECAAAPAKPAPAPVMKKRTEITKEQRTVYFDFNKSTLTADAKQRLDTLANAIKSDKDIKEARIFGYADRFGTPSYNDQLSMKRAESVKSYLMSRGVVNARTTETRWFGESVPATNCPESLAREEAIQCLQKDRRVEVEIDYNTAQ